MNCNQCGSFGGCRCAINAAGLATAAGSGTGASPRDIGVSCEDVQDCVASMFTDIGFEYNDATNSIVVPSATPIDYVLTAVGDGTAVWAAPPAPPSGPGVLIYDTRNWDGATSFPNTGSAGSSFDLVVSSTIYAHSCDAGASGAPNWTLLGGNPGDAPFSFIFKAGPDITVESCYCDIGFYSNGDWNLECFDLTQPSQSQTNTYIDGTGTLDEIDSYSDATHNPDNGSTWIMQIDPAAYTAELYRNNVLVASASDASIASALNADLVGDPYSWTIYCSGALTDVAGNVWSGLSGFAMTRTLLNSAERIAWAAYFG